MIVDCEHDLTSTSWLSEWIHIVCFCKYVENEPT